MKLSAQELRIGNYFLYDNRIQVVNGVIDINGGYRIDFKTEHKRKLVKYCHPIPLTEEWLMKFGFEWNKETKTYEHKVFYPWHVSKSINIDIQNWQVFNYVLQAVANRKIKYVHQLQNLYFALTGDELTIRN